MGGRGFRCRKSGSLGELRRGRQDCSAGAGGEGLGCGGLKAAPRGSVGGLGSLGRMTCRSDRLGALCRRQPSPGAWGECSGTEEPGNGMRLSSSFRPRDRQSNHHHPAPGLWPQQQGHTYLAELTFQPKPRLPVGRAPCSSPAAQQWSQLGEEVLESEWGDTGVFAPAPPFQARGCAHPVGMVCRVGLRPETTSWPGRCCQHEMGVKGWPGQSPGGWYHLTGGRWRT